MANENYDPCDQVYWEKGKGKKGKKGKSKFQYPYDGNKGYLIELHRIRGYLIFVERAIRVFKDNLYKRIENEKKDK